MFHKLTQLACAWCIITVRVCAVLQAQASDRAEAQTNKLDRRQPAEYFVQLTLADGCADVGDVKMSEAGH